MSASESNLGIVIPTLNAISGLPGALASLDAGRARFAMDIVVADAGSSDGTRDIARESGARTIDAPRGRGPQLAAGADVVVGDWLLFLHADTVLGPDWPDAVAGFIGRADARHRAGFFKLELDDETSGARRIERLAAWRARRLALPYGDQGLVLSRHLYEQTGGFADMPLMEDVDLVRRIVRRHGRDALVPLGAAARTSAVRYRNDGYWRRPARNLCCLALYFAGVPPRTIARIYG